jgi:hypothetical protein
MIIVMIVRVQAATMIILMAEVHMKVNRLLNRSLWLNFFVVVVSACATRPEIPPPTVPIPQARQMVTVEQIIAPPQKAWQWDANRWFTAELDYGCHGPIRFFDEKNGIDTYVGNDHVPRITFASDDPDVVLAMVASDGYRSQLVFSTDGGRHFVQEVRGLPPDQITEFVIVKRGRVYIGMQLLGRDPDGYFEWQQPKYRNSWEEGVAVETRKLVILAAPLDKVRSRIDWYFIVAPKNYQFRHEDAHSARDYITRVDDIDSLELPHVADFPPSDACGRTIKLPPWSSMMGKEGLIKFYDWYESMKATHPGWANAKTDELIAWDRNWHRGLLIPGAKTPAR